MRLGRATGLGPWTVALHSLRGPGRRTYRLVRCILSSFHRRFATVRHHGCCQHYIGTRSTSTLLQCGQTLVPGKLSAVERRQVRRHDTGHFCSAEVRCSRNHRRRCQHAAAVCWSRHKSSRSALFYSHLRFDSPDSLKKKDREDNRNGYFISRK